MGLGRSRKMGLALLSVVIVACTPSGAQPLGNPSPLKDSCTLSTLQLGPEGFAPYGLARAGPLWFSAFDRVDPGTPARLAATGPLDGWKIVIHPDSSATGTVNLSGVDCSSGAPVRFCYSGCDWTDRLRSSVAVLPVDVSSHFDYTGYMVFPGPGLMRLTTTVYGPVGSVVIEVPQLAS